ncbi:DUF4157 domain-containing protein [Massilia sp. CF038]|uniref:eCIS core domain-containing protein n=1 Tax=Massilia sp. CF038 TaxID=1881045 RepID=UPI000916C899|nr:DUF4157 domain-containing protein [Massilia sp. CF038]SHG39130.1 protein of unknown function [Massilia sp. CF038]
MRMFASRKPLPQQSTPSTQLANGPVSLMPSPAPHVGRDFSQVPTHGAGRSVIQRKMTAAPVQRLASLAREVSASLGAPAQVTAMPHPLRQGLESMSGMDFGDIRVHRNSPLPAQARALAFTRGRDIHLAPGQEAHLPHEAWHVVQQRQGRVNATAHVGRFAVNDHAGLEQEADVMGAKAASLPASRGLPKVPPVASRPTADVAQRKIQITGLDDAKRKNFLAKINEGSVLKFDMDATGLLKEAEPGKKSIEVYSNEILGAVNDAQTVILNLVAQNDANFIDSFVTGQVDYDDMKDLPFNMFRIWLLHFVIERFAMANYEASKAGASEADFKAAHIKGHEAQERQMREWFPKKTIKFIKEGFDAATQVVDAAGNGTMDYVFDFTDVKHVFKQPVVANKAQERIISSKIIVIR